MSFARAPVNSSLTNSPRSQGPPSPFLKTQSGHSQRRFVNSGHGGSVCHTKSDATPSVLTSEWTDDESMMAGGAKDGYVKEKKKHGQNSRNLSATSSVASEEGTQGGEKVVAQGMDNSEVVIGMRSFIAEQSLKIAVLEKENAILSSSGVQDKGGKTMVSLTSIHLQEVAEVYPVLLEARKLLISCVQEEGGQAVARDGGVSNVKNGTACQPTSSSKSSSKQGGSNNGDEMSLKELARQLKEMACLQKSAIMSLKLKNKENSRMIRYMEKEVARYCQQEKAFPGGNSSHSNDHSNEKSESTGSPSSPTKVLSGRDDHGKSKTGMGSDTRERGVRGPAVLRFPSFDELRELQAVIEERQESYRIATSTVQRLTQDLQLQHQENDFLREQLKREQNKSEAMRALFSCNIAAATAEGGLEAKTGLDGRSKSTAGASSATTSIPPLVPPKEYSTEHTTGVKDNAAVTVYYHLFKGREYVLAFEKDPDAFKVALKEDLFNALSFLSSAQRNNFNVSIHSEVRSVIAEIDIPNIGGNGHKKKNEAKVQLLDYWYPQVEQVADRTARHLVDDETITSVDADMLHPSRHHGVQGGGKGNKSRNDDGSSSSADDDKRKTTVAVLLGELQECQNLLATREKEMVKLQQGHEKWLQAQKRDAAEVDEAIKKVLEESENNIQEVQKASRQKERELMMMSEKLSALEREFQQQEQERRSLEDNRTTSGTVMRLQMELTALKEERKTLREALQNSNSRAYQLPQERKDDVEDGRVKQGRRGSDRDMSSHRSSEIRTFTEVVDCTIPLSSVDLAEQMNDIIMQQSNTATVHALLLHTLAVKAGAIPLKLRRCAVELQSGGQAVIRARVELGFTCLTQDQKILSENLRCHLDRCSAEVVPVLEEYLSLMKEWGGIPSHFKDGQSNSRGSGSFSSSLAHRGRLSISQNKELVEFLESMLSVGERLSCPELVDQLALARRKYEEIQELVTKNRNEILQLQTKYRLKVSEVDGFRQAGGVSARKEEDDDRAESKRGGYASASEMELKGIISSKDRDVQRLKQELETIHKREKMQAALLDEQNQLLEVLDRQVQSCSCTEMSGAAGLASSSSSLGSTSRNNNGVAGDGKDAAAVHRLEALLSNALTEKDYLARKVAQLEQDLEDLVIIQHSLQDGMESAQRHHRESQSENDVLRHRLAVQEETLNKWKAAHGGEEGSRNTSRISSPSLSFSSLPLPASASSSSPVTPVAVIHQSISLLSGLLKNTSSSSPATSGVHKEGGSGLTPINGTDHSKGIVNEEENIDLMMRQLLSLIQEVAVVLYSLRDSGNEKKMEKEKTFSSASLHHSSPPSSLGSPSTPGPRPACSELSKIPTGIPRDSVDAKEHGKLSSSLSAVSTGATPRSSHLTENDISTRLASLASGSRYAAWIAKRKVETEDTPESKGSNEVRSCGIKKSSVTSSKESTSNPSGVSPLGNNPSPSSQSTASSSSSPIPRPSTTSDVLARSTQFLSSLRRNRLAPGNAKPSQTEEKKK